jgi:CelD/BcsL family acetyltransferase involved in cellulose biosynthesis
MRDRDAALEVMVATQPQQLEDLRPVWQRLHAAQPAAPLFAGPDWCLAWWRAFGASKEPRVLALRRGGELVGVLPLVRARLRCGPHIASPHAVQPEDLDLVRSRSRLALLPVVQLAPFANLPSGCVRASWLLDASLDGETAWRAWLRALARRSDWHVLVAPRVSLDDEPPLRAAARAAECAAREGGTPAALYELLLRPWPEWFAARSGHFRRRYQAAERAFGALGAWTLEVVEAAELDAALDATFALARASWKQSPREGQALHVPMTPVAEGFFRELAHAGAARGDTMLLALRQGGSVVGVLLGLRSGRTLTLLQTFFDARVARASPGRMLMRGAIEWGVAQGVVRIDTNGNSPLVRMFADVPVASRSLTLFGRGLWSRALHGVAHAATAYATRTPASEAVESPPRDSGESTDAR